MSTYFTPRQRRLMGLPELEELRAPAPSIPARCCDKASFERCSCEAVQCHCPEHGTRSQPCNPNLSHD